MPDEPTKTCCACGLEKPAAAFSPDRRRSDGLQGRCRECFNAARNARRAADPERDRARDRARYAASEERRQAIKDAVARLHERDPEYVRRYNVARYAETAEQRKAASRADYESNRNRRLAQKKAAYEADPEKMQDRQRRWAAANPEKVAGFAAARAQRELDAWVEEVPLAEIGERDGWRCHICRKRVDPALRYPHPLCATRDHLIPLVHGGLHERSNVKLAHWACNRKRGDGRSPAQLLLL